jgi:hypothetical protein
MANNDMHHVKHVLAALSAAVEAHGDMGRVTASHAADHHALLEQMRADAEVQSRITDGIARQNG